MILRPGDHVAIIAPAGHSSEQDATLLDDAAALLRSWDLRVTTRVERDSQFYLAGTDEARAAHLHAALADPTTQAIFSARGGYGCTRLFRLLDPGLKPGPRILVGYSDITALHLAVQNLWPDVASIHGPNVATHQFLGPDSAAQANRAALRAALFDPLYEVDETVEFLRKGRVVGSLRGGCLSLLAATMGSRFSPRTEGSVLFIEDVNEKPYRIDRMLIQLRNADLFRNVAGVVFGIMHQCADDRNDLRAVICDVLSDYQFPVAFGLGAGHGERNVPLPLGAQAMLDSDAGRFRIGHAV